MDDFSQNRQKPAQEIYIVFSESCDSVSPNHIFVINSTNVVTHVQVERYTVGFQS